MLIGVVTPGLGSEVTTLLGGGRAGFEVVAGVGGVTGGGGGGGGAEGGVDEGGGGEVAGGEEGGGAEVLGSCRFACRCLGLIFSAAITESWRTEIRSKVCNFMTTGGKEGGSRQRVED